jgi:hypothetical protein
VANYLVNHHGFFPRDSLNFFHPMAEDRRFD